MIHVSETTIQQERRIHYPESDGQPMADNTRQFRWIVLIKENLDTLFRQREDVFVAGDLLWYPVTGHPEICRAPDVLVVFGRPKGDRGSYRQWVEDGIAPQVVFEVRSPANSLKEMLDKIEFYDTYGVDEYYTYNPDPEYRDLTGFLRQGERLRPIAEMNGWVSPSLGIRFDTSGEELRLVRPDGVPFYSHQELEQERETERLARQQAEQRATQAEQERETEQLARQQAEQEREAERLARQQAEQRATQAEQRATILAAKLRELGIDSDGEESV